MNRARFTTCFPRAPIASSISFASGETECTSRNWGVVGAAAELKLAFGCSVAYVAFKDFLNGQKMSVMANDGSGWSLVGQAGFGGNGSYAFDLAADGSGVPHLSFVDNGDPQKITVLRFNGVDAWEPVGAASFSLPLCSSSALAFGPGDVPMVAYTDNDGQKASVMWYVDGAWQSLGRPRFSSGPTASTVIAVSPVDAAPFVAYIDYDNGQRITVQTLHGCSSSLRNHCNRFQHIHLQISIRTLPHAGMHPESPDSHGFVANAPFVR